MFCCRKLLRALWVWLMRCRNMWRKKEAKPHTGHAPSDSALAQQSTAASKSCSICSCDTWTSLSICPRDREVGNVMGVQRPAQHSTASSVPSQLMSLHLSYTSQEGLWLTAKGSCKRYWIKVDLSEIQKPASPV